MKAKTINLFILFSTALFVLLIPGLSNADLVDQYDESILSIRLKDGRLLTGKILDIRNGFYTVQIEGQTSPETVFEDDIEEILEDAEAQDMKAEVPSAAETVPLDSKDSGYDFVSVARRAMSEPDPSQRAEDQQTFAEIQRRFSEIKNDEALMKDWASLRERYGGQPPDEEPELLAYPDFQEMLGNEKIRAYMSAVGDVIEARILQPEGPGDAQNRFPPAIEDKLRQIRQDPELKAIISGIDGLRGPGREPRRLRDMKDDPAVQRLLRHPKMQELRALIREDFRHQFFQ